MHHPAGHDELPYSIVKTYKSLIGGEDHIFEAGSRRDGFHLASGLLKSGTQSLPLLLGLLAIHRNILGHVRVFLIDDLKIGRRTQQDVLRHLMEW
jgi:hypothetical protein